MHVRLGGCTVLAEDIHEFHVAPRLFVLCVKHMVKPGDFTGARLSVSIGGGQLDFAVEEKAEPIPGLNAAPGARRTRGPTGNPQLILGSGYQKASISDKRGTMRRCCGMPNATQPL